MPDRTIRQQVLVPARRVVVKVGTHGVCDDSGRLDTRSVRSLARQMVAILEQGRAVTLVASGAIGAGLRELDLPARPKSVPELQAVAAVGQGQLMRAFHDAFARRGVRVAQVLLTRDDFEDRTRYLNIRNTLRALHEMGALAIINENDAVAIDEIRYGDNDIIAAHVANMLAAEVLVFLSTVDGVLDGEEVVDVVQHGDDEAHGLASDDRSRLGSGGMASKMAAAGIVTKAGEVAVIANARTPNVLVRLLAGKRLGTLFAPARRKLSSRRRWIGQASRPAGKLALDDGAVRAILERGKSLLPAGIVDVQGRFGKGATVALTDTGGREIARGLTNYSADQLRRIKGLKSPQIPAALGDKPYDEAVHRNNMTLR